VAYPPDVESGMAGRGHSIEVTEASGHPIARSAEPREDWSWCYVDNLAFVVTGP
jgi:hypothetical protein